MWTLIRLSCARCSAATEATADVSSACVRAAAAAITVQDIRSIEKLAADPDVLDILARSLAPSIYGHRLIKRGLILLLLGGRCALITHAACPGGPWSNASPRSMHLLLHPCMVAASAEAGSSSHLVARHPQAGIRPDPLERIMLFQGDSYCWALKFLERQVSEPSCPRR